MIRRQVRIREIVDRAVLIFSKDFFYFTSDTIKKQGITKLYSYSCKSNTTVVLSDFKASILGKRNMEPFVHFSIVLFTHSDS